jgi:site-specific DNA-methyltransferase (adenine-specific)
VEKPVIVDQLFCSDARLMTDDQVADRSVALLVTSPPYFTGKEYETDLALGHVPASYVEYLEMLHDVLAVCLTKLEPGGRMAINIANLGRKPYRSLSSDLISILQDDLGMLLRGEIIWQKARGAGGSCAWGSFRSPQNPVLRDVTERVVIASKGRFDRAITRPVREAQGLPHEPTIETEDFLEATIDVWEIPAASATRVGHPAPFPVELPRRLIELYTFRGDLVLDPFIGSGTTAVAAIGSGRHYVGFDTEQSYIDLAERRIAEAGP